MAANRVEEGMAEWSQHSYNMQQIFGAGILQHRVMQGAQLTHYRVVDKRPFPFMTGEEKLTRLLLRAEIKRMEKALYPSRIIRIGRFLSRNIAALKKEKTAAPEETVIAPKINERKPFVQTAMIVRKQSPGPEKLIQKRQGSKNNLLEKKRVRQPAGIKR